MVQCFIDGKVAVPRLADNIKLTLENPYIKEKDSYTYDIVFPLDIAENVLVFGARGRLDTSKRIRQFDDCILTVDNITVIRGVGTVTAVNQDELKLQILAGASSLRYRSDFSRIYIDRLTYPQVPQKYRTNHTRWNIRLAVDGQYTDVSTEVRNNRYIGDISTAVFMPVRDASNDCIANRINVYLPGEEGETGDIARYCLLNRAVQPNLMMVLRTVLSSMGYTVKGNVYDVAPWNELIICSARQTAIIAKALPHWTVRKFLDEFRKLFNAAFLFNEDEKTVDIVRADAADQTGTVSYEAADEFSSDYDEEGLDYIGSSNIGYNLSGLSETLVEVPEDVTENFDTREYNTTTEMANAFDAMTVKEKLTTLLVDPLGFLYGSEVTDSEGQKTGEIQLQRFGYFSRILRDTASDNTIELDMCPVAMNYVEFVLLIAEYPLVEYNPTVKAWLPEIENSEVVDQDANTADDADERSYVTVEEVVAAGESATREETEEEQTMQLMWVGQFNQYLVGEDGIMELVYPECHVDWRIGNCMRYYTLALTHAGGHPYIGQFHEHSTKINMGGNIDANDEQKIPFLCDGIPDPSLNYIFNGKRFLCSKIDVSISDDGIDRLKTGYFYEILE
ncbi:MAG: hypothetical protein II886_13065 [Prevotella sp.]|nr:hypothetical protein [Prevotella sp.]